MSADFNPNSIDATLAKILANQEQHGEKLDRIEAKHTITADKVQRLEQDKWYVRGVTATVGLLAPGAWELLKK